MKIVILNQKGGVGKSTITVNLGYGLAQKNKILIVDLDPQSHSSLIYTAELKDKTIGDLIKDKNPDTKSYLRQATVLNDENNRENIDNLFIIPANIHLAKSAEIIFTRHHREKILHKNLNKIEKYFDYMIIDCPPTLNVLTVNAIYTADLIIIPTDYGRYALDGISDLFESIADIREDNKCDYKILRNQKDSRALRTNEAIEDQLAQFNNNLLDTVIFKTEAINQALMASLPIYLFDPKSKAVKNFNSLVEEILSYD